MAANETTYTPDVSTADGRRELNRRIAQARGWKLIDAPPKRGKPGFTMVLRPTDDPLEQYDMLPEPADDNAAAFELLAGCDYDITRFRPGVPGYNGKEFKVLILSTIGLPVGEANTFASAAAIAWWRAFGEG